MDIAEGNKLIAEFMGYKYFGHNDPENIGTPGWKLNHKASIPKLHDVGEIGKRHYLCRRHTDLRFYNSWDWLMPVVEKIESEGFKTRICFDDFGQWMQIHYGLSIVGTKETKAVNIGASKLENTYDSVIDFIKWWNIKIG